MERVSHMDSHLSLVTLSHSVPATTGARRASLCVQALSDVSPCPAGPPRLSAAPSPGARRRTRCGHLVEQSSELPALQEYGQFSVDGISRSGLESGARCPHANGRVSITARGGGSFVC